MDSSSGRTVVKVVLPRGNSHDGDADIEVSVPKGSSVEVSAVSADVSSRGVLGTQRLKSVSGEITADIAGDESEVRSVSGDVTVRGDGKPIRLRVRSVSGSLDLTNAAGTLDVVTVSGDARVHMGDTSEVRGRTTSGDLEVSGKLTRDGRVDVEGVSGDITLRLSAPGGLSTEIESFSGDIDGCLADNVERVSKYGPGMRLNLRTVEAARVSARRRCRATSTSAIADPLTPPNPRGRHRYNVGRVRLLKWVSLGLGALVALVVLGVLVIVWLVDPNSFKSNIEAAVRDATGREFTLVGDIDLGFFPWLALRTGEGRFGNAPGFGPEPMVTWKSAQLGVKLIPAAARRAGRRPRGPRGRRCAPGAPRRRQRELAGPARHQAGRSQRASPGAEHRRRRDRGQPPVVRR